MFIVIFYVSGGGGVHFVAKQEIKVCLNVLHLFSQFAAEYKGC